MKDYEKLADSLDKRMLDFNLKILAFLASILLRPLAACTQVIFRQNLGERYFNETTMILSAILWIIPQLFGWPAVRMRNGWLHELGYRRLETWLSGHVDAKMALFTFITSAVFWFFASRNLAQTRQRQADGVAWYSMSRGESRFGNENASRDFAISFVVSAVLLFFAPSFGFLFIASRVAGYYLYVKEQQAYYQRYLDEMDAKIMAGHLEPALNGKQPPRQTGGLNCPLPARIKGERRVHVAKVVAAGAFVRQATNTPPHAPAPTASSAPTATGPGIPPQSYQPVGSGEVTQPIKSAVQTVAPFLKSKLFRNLVLIVIALVVGKYVFQNIHWHSDKLPAVAPVRTSTIQTAEVEKHTDVPVISTTAMAATPAVEREAAQPQSVPRQSGETEIQRQKTERENVIKALTGSIAAEQAKLHEFNVHGKSLVLTNGLNIENAARSQRSALHQENEMLYSLLQQVILAQTQAINSFQDDLGKLPAAAMSSVQAFQSNWERSVVTMEQDRQAIRLAFETLATKITNAPAKGGLFNFRFSSDGKK